MTGATSHIVRLDLKGVRKCNDLVVRYASGRSVSQTKPDCVRKDQWLVYFGLGSCLVMVSSYSLACNPHSAAFYPRLFLKLFSPSMRCIKLRHPSPRNFDVQRRSQHVPLRSFISKELSLLLHILDYRPLCTAPLVFSSARIYHALQHKSSDLILIRGACRNTTRWNSSNLGQLLVSTTTMRPVGYFNNLKLPRT